MKTDRPGLIAAALIVAGAVLAIGAARADTICPDGKTLGSENDRPNGSWLCLDATSQPPRAPSADADWPDGRAGDIARLTRDLAALLQATDNADRVGEGGSPIGVQGVLANRKAFAHLQAGRNREAKADFEAAARMAKAAGNAADASANLRNARIASAIDGLAQGYRAEVKGRATTARLFYRQADLEIAHLRSAPRPAAPAADLPGGAGQPRLIPPPAAPRRPHQSDISGLGARRSSETETRPPSQTPAATSAQSTLPRRSAPPAVQRAPAEAAKANGIMIDVRPSSSTADLSDATRTILDLAQPRY